jgi:glycosidase
MGDIRQRLETIYGDKANKTYYELREVIDDFKKRILITEQPGFTEKDVGLICYANHVFEKHKKTLPSMRRFLQEYAKGIINKVHFLPFSPYSSDDGFSVIDYYQVNPDFGNWDDIKAIGREFRMMFDLVINHISGKSEWFKGFLDGEEKYQNYFISYDEEVDVSSVFRPRTHKLLSDFDTKKGIKFVWTTFSKDQIDLNFSNPEVLIEMINVLLFYIEKGARVIRLDAIAFLWKKLGTNCLHLKETHEIVKLFRDIFDEISEALWIITETNVPHKDNISYFGEGEDEAHMVYNFTLPPLLMYSFYKKNTEVFRMWVDSLKLPSPKTAFFNFTASHDGVGVTPLKNIVPDEEIHNLAKVVLARGGKVNYRDVPGKEPFPYELNIVYLEAFDTEKAFLCSQSVALALKGVPGIYFNSLIGAENWDEGVEKLGYNRAINRQKFELSKLINEIEKPDTVKNIVYHEYKRMLQARINEKLFSPLAEQDVHDFGKDIFALERMDKSNNENILCLFNFTDSEQEIDANKISRILRKKYCVDLISHKEFNLEDNVKLPEYGYVWLK